MLRAGFMWVVDVLAHRKSFVRRRGVSWEHEPKADPPPNGALESGQSIPIKFSLEISDKEQKDRIEGRIDDPLRRRELSPMDLDVIVQ